MTFDSMATLPERSGVSIIEDGEELSSHVEL